MHRAPAAAFSAILAALCAFVAANGGGEGFGFAAVLFAFLALLPILSWVIARVMRIYQNMAELADLEVQARKATLRKKLEETRRAEVRERTERKT